MFLHLKYNPNSNIHLTAILSKCGLYWKAVDIIKYFGYASTTQQIKYRLKNEKILKYTDIMSYSAKTNVLTYEQALIFLNKLGKRKSEAFITWFKAINEGFLKLYPENMKKFNTLLKYPNCEGFVYVNTQTNASATGFTMPDILKQFFSHRQQRQQQQPEKTNVNPPPIYDTPPPSNVKPYSPESPPSLAAAEEESSMFDADEMSFDYPVLSVPSPPPPPSVPMDQGEIDTSPVVDAADDVKPLNLSPSYPAPTLLSSPLLRKLLRIEDDKERIHNPVAATTTTDDDVKPLNLSPSSPAPTLPSSPPPRIEDDKERIHNPVATTTADDDVKPLNFSPSSPAPTLPSSPPPLRIDDDNEQRIHSPVAATTTADDEDNHSYYPQSFQVEDPISNTKFIYEPIDLNWNSGDIIPSYISPSFVMNHDKMFLYVPIKI